MVYIQSNIKIVELGNSILHLQTKFTVSNTSVGTIRVCNQMFKSAPFEQRHSLLSSALACSADSTPSLRRLVPENAMRIFIGLSNRKYNH